MVRCTILAALAIYVAFSDAIPRGRSRRQGGGPNVLLIMTDDQGSLNPINSAFVPPLTFRR